MNADERIGRLERANRRLGLAVAALVMGLGIATAMGAQARPGRIDATELHLIGEDGMTQAVLGVRGDDAVLAIGSDGQGGTVVIGANHDGSSNISVMSHKYKSGIRISVDKDGAPSIRIRDQRGRTITEAP